MTEYELNPQKVKAEYENAVDYDLLTEIEKIINISRSASDSSKNLKGIIYRISSVSQRAASDIKHLTGIDVAGYASIIDGSHIIHIWKRHGENGEADETMKNLKDLARIAYILENYDNIEYKGGDSGYRNPDGSKGKVVAFHKRINGCYSVFEVVFNSKSKILKVKTAYKKGVEETPPTPNRCAARC